MGKGIVFRCDFGGTRGWGHVVRCSSLAMAARRKGLRTCLVSRRAMEELPGEVREAFDDFHLVSQAIPTEGFWHSLVGPESEWGCVVVDQYDYARRELQLLKNALVLAEALLVVIDDEAKRDLSAADLVVNHVVGASASLYPSFIDVLAGEQYALMRPGFTRKPAAESQVEGLDALKRPVLVMFGGTDPRNLSGTCLRFLSDCVDEPVDPILVRTRQVAFRDEIDKELRKFKNALWLEQVSSEELARIFRTALFAVTACGGSVNEVAYCRLPFIGVVVAPNQERMALSVRDDWKMPILQAETLNKRNFRSACAQMAKRMKELAPKKGGERPAYARIDGQGAQRVIDAVLECMR